MSRGLVPRYRRIITVAVPVMGGLAAFAGTVHAQHTLTVRVYDAEAGTPLGAAAVQLVRDGKVAGIAETDARGGAVIALTMTGMHEIHVTRDGYLPGTHSIRVGAERDSVIIRLAPAPIPLEAIEAIGGTRNRDLELSGFYARKEHNRGHFIDRATIEERRSARQMSDLLRGVPGVRIVQGGGRSAVYMRGTQGFSGGATGCSPRVLVDRIIVHPGGREPALLDDIIRPDDVSGLEVYRSPAETPSEFGGAESSCGVIVVWSRLRR